MKREDFADEAAWHAWQQTQLDARRVERPKEAPPKRRAYSTLAKDKRLSPRLRKAYGALEWREYVSRKLSGDEGAWRAMRREGDRRRAHKPSRIASNRRSYVRRREYRLWSLRQWRATHQEHIAAYGASYRANHRWERNKASRNYYYANRAKMAAKHQAYYQENAERLRSYSRDYYARHREQILARKKAERQEGAA